MNKFYHNELRRATQESVEYLSAALAGEDAEPEEIERLFWKGWAALGARAGGEVPELESVPDEEYLQDSLMGYTGSNPILRAARRAALGEKALLDEAGAVEMAKSAADAESAGRVTGDEAHEVIVAGPRKGITKVSGK